MFKEIRSPKNGHYKRWMSLHDSKGIKKHSQCLVSGSKIVPEIIEQSFHLSLEIVTSDQIATPLDPHQVQKIQSYVIPHSLFKQLDLFGTGAPLLIAKVPKMEDFSSTCLPVGLEVLCELGDPHNLGALARCCEAFQASQLILLKGSVHPFHPKVIRSSSGSVFRIPIKIDKDRSLGDMDLDVVALDREGEKIEEFSWPQNIRLLMGAEGQGLPKSLKATRISIPMASGIESLNVVSASSIALYSHYIHIKKSLNLKKS